MQTCGFNGFSYADIAAELGITKASLHYHFQSKAELGDALIARYARRFADALSGIEGLTLPCPETGRVRRGWFVYVVQLPRGRDRDGVVRSLATRGVPSKPYFPAVHLMSYYRERFGHREGQFPVCEDVAARSIALPFFPEMTESQVEQVAEAVRDVLGRS